MKKYLNLSLLVFGVFCFSTSHSETNGIASVNKGRIVETFNENLKQNNLEVANDLLFLPPEIRKQKYKKLWFKILHSISVLSLKVQCERTMTQTAVVLVISIDPNDIDPVFFLKQKESGLFLLIHSSEVIVLKNVCLNVQVTYK